VYDSNGNLISDPEKNHIYKWDVLGRLMEIRGASNALVAEFRYNALGYRIAERIAAEGEDWTRLVYDARWRIVATYKIDVSQDEEALSERFVYHAAGLDGLGGGSYIDALVLRDRDADGNGSLEERHYYCQSWRHDVVAIIDHQGRQIEHMRYTPYGVPISIPMSDKDRNGELEQADVDAMVAAITAYTNPSGSGYQVEFDNDLDGDIDFTDLSLTIAQMNAIGTDPIGRRVLSAYGHRAGYAGYQWMPAAGLYHVRHRWYDSENGDWLSPNPLSYVDGLNLLQCARSSPVNRTDPAGEIAPLVILGIIATIAALDELAHAPTLDDTTEVRRALEEERDQEQMIELIMIPAGGAIGLGIGSVGS
jgi:RHS repeat-associated protein